MLRGPICYHTERDSEYFTLLALTLCNIHDRYRTVGLTSALKKIWKCGQKTIHFRLRENLNSIYNNRLLISIVCIGCVQFYTIHIVENRREAPTTQVQFLLSSKETPLRASACFQCVFQSQIGLAAGTYHEGFKMLIWASASPLSDLELLQNGTNSCYDLPRNVR